MAGATLLESRIIVGCNVDHGSRLHGKRTFFQETGRIRPFSDLYLTPDIDPPLQMIIAERPQKNPVHFPQLAPDLHGYRAGGVFRILLSGQYWKGVHV